MKKVRLLGFALAVSACVSVMSAETLEEVVEARNKGAELMQADDFSGAIASLEKCVSLSKQLGADADEHRLVAEKALPGLYLAKAKKVFETKDYEATLTAYNETLAAAEKYNNADIKATVEKLYPDLYCAIGTEAYKKNDLAKAITNLDLATTREPDYAKAYYIKGAVYQKQKNEAKMVENFKLAVEKAAASKDNSTLKGAKGAWSKYFYNKGIMALQAKKLDAAITAFTATVEADDSFADAYWRLATCYNNKKAYDKAIENGEKALQYKKSGQDGIYFELGTAYMGKKENAKACDAFAKVTSAPYADNAKYQRKNILKCK